MSILELKDLVVSFSTDQGKLKALDRVSFSIPRGKTVGIVGESGCGKSVTSLAIMRLLPKPSGNIDSGSIIYNNQDLVKIPKEDMHKIRGREISMIFQEPMTALNPVQPISDQMIEIFDKHFPKLGKLKALEQSIQLLHDVGIPDAPNRIHQYPHQFSGGMRQRVVIAMALACKPKILIADEPTTALDVTIQAQILKLMKELQKREDMSIIFITHDLGVIAELCDEVIVMYAGQVVEQANVMDLFKKPRHPYTKGLLESIPSLSHQRKSKLASIDGLVPSLQNMPSGCRFENRCQYRDQLCKDKEPIIRNSDTGLVRCHHYEKVMKEVIEK